MPTGEENVGNQHLLWEDFPSGGVPIQADVITNASVKLFKRAKFLGSTFAVRFFYGFLYHFLKRTHTDDDHRLQETSSASSSCDCDCVLDKSVDLFLEQCGSLEADLVRNSSPIDKSSKRYVILCDPVLQKPCNKTLSCELSKLGIVMLKSSNPAGAKGVEFLANGYKKTLPVYMHRTEQRIIITELSTPCSVMGYTMSSIAENAGKSFDHNLSWLQTSDDFIATLRLLLHEEADHVNADYIRIVRLMRTTRKAQVDVNIIARKVEDLLLSPHVADADEEDVTTFGKIRLDLDSLIAVNILNIVHGLLHPLMLSLNNVQKNKIQKYYVVFPKSGSVSILPLGRLLRDKDRDISVNISSECAGSRMHSLQAYTYNNQSFYLLFPPFLRFCHQLEDTECCLNIHSSSMIDAMQVLGRDIKSNVCTDDRSLSWLMAEELRIFCDEFSKDLAQNGSKAPFQIDMLDIVLWDDEQEPNLAENELLNRLGRVQ